MTKSKRKPELQARRQPTPERSARPHPFGIRTRGFLWISSFGFLRSFVIYHLFLLLATGTTFAQNQFIGKVGQLEVEGNFKQATILLNERLALPSLAQNERKSLEFERDRLDRIKKDFPYTTEDLFGELQRSVKGLTRAEYDSWTSEGRFDSRQIDGQRYFMSSSVANLFFRYPELNSRRTPPKPTASLEKAYWQNCVEIKRSSQDQTPGGSISISTLQKSSLPI